MKEDIDKIVQEQKYQQFRLNYEASGKPNPEKERQLKHRGRLIESLNSLHSARKYYPFEGFTIFWDWVINAPKRYESAKI